MSKTYFNQRDSRWANKMYSSTGNASQTIKSSGCGPTAASIIVTSLTNNVIFPHKMADLFIQNGFRTPSSGTSWSAFKWVAQNYNLNFEQGLDKNKVTECLKSGGMVIVSVVGSSTALFSTNGHFIVLVGIKEDGRIIIYDSDLYNGKYDLSHRKNKATVNGNEVYVSLDNIHKESRQYFYYKSSEAHSNPSNTDGIIKTVINVSTRLRIRNTPNGDIIGYLKNGDKVTVYEEVNNWARIDLGWVSCSYLSNPTNIYTTGKYKVTTSVLNVRTGPGTNYPIKQFSQLSANAQSQIKVLSKTAINGYVKGIVCTVSEVNNNWGRTPSGWICLDYVSKVNV